MKFLAAGLAPPSKTPQASQPGDPACVVAVCSASSQRTLHLDSCGCAAWTGMAYGKQASMITMDACRCADKFSYRAVVCGALAWS